MPVTAQQSQPAAGAAIVLDGGGATPTSGAQQHVPLTRLTDSSAFHFCASLAELQLLPGGDLVPDLPQITHAEGVNGAGGSGQPGVALDLQRRKGRLIVPHAFPCRAWDEDRAGYLTHSLAGLDREGREIWCYHDVWHRPVFLGSRFIEWEFDDAGWADFRARVMAWLLREQGLSAVPDIYRSIVERRLQGELSHIAARSDPASEARKADLASRLKRPKKSTTKEAAGAS